MSSVQSSQNRCYIYNMSKNTQKTLPSLSGKCPNSFFFPNQRQISNSLRAVEFCHACCALGLNEQRLGLAVLYTRLAVLSQLLDPALDPRLATLNLCRLGLENNVAPCRTRSAVIDLKTRRHADLVGQRRETGSCKSLVQKRRQKTAMHNRRVAAEVGTQVGNLRQARQLLALVRQAERRDFDLARAQQHAARQVVRAHGLGDLEMRARLDDALLCAQARRERVCEDVRVDLGGCGRGGLEEGEGLGIGGRGQDAVDGVCGGRGGHDEACCEGEDDEGGGDEGVCGFGAGRAGGW